MRVAIIGAGLAGLSCAAGLRARKIAVSVFDKGRGPGGRMSTRRAQTPLGEVQFDHGAPCFTPRDPEFLETVADWTRLGLVAHWDARHFKQAADGTRRRIDDAFWVGAPSMNAIVRYAAEPFSVEWGRRVSHIRGEAGAYRLEFEDGSFDGPFDHVVSAVPAEQAAELLSAPAPELSRRAAQIVSRPCWTLMCAFEKPVETGFDSLWLGEDAPLAVLVRNTSKPGRGPVEAWVVQAGADWSAENLELSADDAAGKLFSAFSELAGAPQPVHAAAHRWRYSQPLGEHAAGAAHDEASRIGACGDWLADGTVEGAWQSGRALCRNISQG